MVAPASFCGAKQRAAGMGLARFPHLSERTPDQRTTRTCRTRLAYLHQASLYPHLRTPSRATRKICCVKVQELALGPFCPNLDGIPVDQLNRFAPGPFSFGPQLQLHVWLLHTCQQLTTLTMIAGSLPNIFAWTRAYWGLGDRSAQK